MVLFLGVGAADAQGRVGPRVRRAATGESAPRGARSPLGRAPIQRGVEGEAAPRSGNADSARRAAPEGAPLSSIGRGRWQTPSGLLLGRGALRAVLNHAADNPRANGTHGVFEGGRRGALSVVNEAWSRARQGGEGVTVESGRNGSRVITVEMGRRVGFVGGAERSHPPASKVRLIVTRNELIAAHPVGEPSAARTAQNTGGNQGRQRQYAPGTNPRNPMVNRGRPWSAVPGTNLRPRQEAASASEIAGRLRERANVPEAIANRGADHIRLGSPTPAARTSAVDSLVVRNGYVMSYNQERLVPNWVSWRVSPGDVAGGSGGANRSMRLDNFRADPALPSNWARATPDDYRNSGYTRGHIVASGERQANVRANGSTFVMTNMMPQTQANNGGAWNHVEHFVRNRAREGSEVHVIAGPGFDGPARTIGANGVAVPDFTWKVAVVMSPGQRFRDLDASNVVAIRVPNTTEVGRDARPYRVTVAEIEAATGMRFFSNLPSDVAERLRSTGTQVDIGSP